MDLFDKTLYQSIIMCILLMKSLNNNHDTLLNIARYVIVAMKQRIFYYDYKLIDAYYTAF